MTALYSFAKATVAPLVRQVWRVRVTGLDHIPATGPVILASNHLSVVDSVIIPSIVPRPVYYLAKDDYFRGTGIKGWFWRSVMYGLNQIPVDRSGGRASLMALDAALPVLRAGNILGIFPEGTRSVDGRLYRGRPGVAKLALDADATLIPVGLIGTEKIQPIGSMIPRFGPGVEMRIGKAVNLEPWRDAPIDSRVLREVTAVLMQEIAALTGQEYVGRYARRRDAGPPAADTGGE
ncbi:MAG TPA: lysophospholipid acyltransferase family protein [Micromonosporaceae bacterium]